MVKFNWQIRNYGVAIAAVLIATLLMLALNPHIDLTKASFLLFFGAVTFTAWYGGRNPGLLATLLSMLSAKYFFLEPLLSLDLTLASGARMVLFALQGVLISILVGALRLAQQQTKESLRQLKASESKFRRLVNANIIGVATCDIYGAISEANDAVLDSLGYSREDLLAGRIRWDEMTPPDLKPLDVPAYEELITKGKNAPYEKAFIGKQGQRVPVVVGAALLEDNPEQVISFILDVSQRRRAEQRLEVQYAIARVLAEANNVADALPLVLRSLSESLGWQASFFWRVDPQTNTLCYLNSWLSPDIEDLSKLVTANQETTFVPGSGLPGRVWESGQAAWIADLAQDTNFLRSTIAFEAGLQSVFGFPVVLNNQILGVVECFSDRHQEPDNDLLQMVTAIGNQIGQFIERKQTEEELQASQTLFQSFMSHCPINAYMKEESGQYLYVNSQLERSFNRPLSEWLGKTDFDLFSTEIAQPVRANDLTVLQTGEGIRIAETGFLEDGEHYFFSYKFPVRDASGRLLLGGMSIDVTELKRTEADRERLLQTLAAERAQFETVLQQMPAGVIIAEAPTGKLLLSNQQAEQIWRNPVLTAHDMSEYQAYQGFHPDGSLYKSEEWPLARSLMAGEVVTDEEIRFVRGDGTAGVMAVSSTPIYDQQGEITAGVVIFQDITQRKQIEAALRESQERLRVALKNAPILVFNQDRELRYTWIYNPAIDFQPSPALYKKDSDLVSPAEAALLTQIKQQVLETGVGRREEVKLTRLDRECHYDLTVEPLKDAMGEVVGVTCAAIDISEIKQAEQALRHSEERFRLLAEQVHVIPWEADPVTGKFTYVGPQATDILGYPIEDWYGDTFWGEHIYTPDREWAIKFCQESALIHDNYDFEYRMLSADGQIVWLYDVVSVVRQGREPKLLRGIMVDITQRKRQEEAQQYLAEFSKVLSSSLDYQTTLNQLANQMVPHLADWCIVHILEENGSIQPVATAHANPAKVKWAEEIRQHYPLDPDEQRGVPQVLRTGQSEFYPAIPDALLVEAARDSEHLRLLREVGFRSVITVPMQAHGNILGTLSLVAAESGRCYDQFDLALAEDVARRAALAVDNARLYQHAQQEQAKAEAANRIKDEFLAVLSHELRTPLNPILGWSNLLQTRKLDEAKTAQALATIERNARLQTQLIEDLLDVSRILRGKLALNAAPVDLVAIMEAAKETVRLAAEAKEIQIQTLLLSKISAVSGDAARLQQVVWNLLSNAVKFTPNGGRIEICLQESDGGDGEDGGVVTSKPAYAQITVSDTGKGISPEFLPYVFDYFRQEDGKTTRKFGGLGLGLAIVRHIVEMHGGTIQASSAGEGMGATFTVRLPLMVRRSVVNPKSQSSEASPDLENIKILVVDDDDDTRNFITFLLEQAGATIVKAASVKEALNVFRQSQPDILVSDIGMPDVDGYTLIQQIRALPADQGGQIPAIALTAYAGDVNEQQALQAGFQRHIAKPVESTELIKIIAELSSTHTISAN